MDQRKSGFTERQTILMKKVQGNGAKDQLTCNINSALLRSRLALARPHDHFHEARQHKASSAVLISVKLTRCCMPPVAT